VVNRDTGSPVSGLYVYIIDTCGSTQRTDYAITNSSGYFSFHPTQINGTPCINLNLKYVVSVNGVTRVTTGLGCSVPNCNVLGQAADNPAWSQWAGDVSTDPNGHGSVVVEDSPARTVNVLASALFSNTQFAAMGFSKTSGQTVSQTVGIQVSIGGASNIQAGYQYNPSYTFSSTNGFGVNPNAQAWFGEPSYVIGYYCAGSTSEQSFGWTCLKGLITAGVTQATGAAFQITPTTENVNPNSAQVILSSVNCTLNVPAGTYQNFGTSGSGSVSSTSSISSTLSLFGISVTLSYSSSTSWQIEDATTVTINPTNGARNFRFYPASGPCNNLVFGPELHVWDFTGDFGVSANPNSVIIMFQGSTNSSTISVTSLSGFSEGVSLSASGPSGIHVSFSPTSVSLSSGGSASSTATISADLSMPIGTYTVTIIGSSATATHSVNISVTLMTGSGGGGGGGGKGCPCKI
jgi:hypothetical protein